MSMLECRTAQCFSWLTIWLTGIAAELLGLSIALPRKLMHVLIDGGTPEIGDGFAPGVEWV
jgi:hypothetical protein